MAECATPISYQQVSKFKPLNQIHPQYQQQLLDRLQIKIRNAGDVILRKRGEIEEKHFSGAGHG